MVRFNRTMLVCLDSTCTHPYPKINIDVSDWSNSGLRWTGSSKYKLHDASASKDMTKPGASRVSKADTAKGNCLVIAFEQP